MSFSRANAPGWSTGDKLTSAQINQIDLDQSRALQAHPAGSSDTIESNVSFNGGVLTANQAGSINVTANTGITVSGGSISVNTANGLFADAFGAVKSLVAGGIQDGVPAGIFLLNTGGLESGTPGGIQLAGGTTDWIVYAQPRTRVLACPLVAYDLSANWTQDGIGALFGGAAATAQFLPLLRFTDGQFNGATLTGAELRMNVSNVHASGVPAVMPAINIYRQSIGTVGLSNPIFQSLYGSGNQSFTPPGSGAAWYASGSIQALTTTPNQNNVIDMSQYMYFLGITDENGANSQSGNTYRSIVLTFTNIGNNGFH